jgi:hypothetical protein
MGPRKKTGRKAAKKRRPSDEALGQQAATAELLALDRDAKRLAMLLSLPDLEKQARRLLKFGPRQTGNCNHVRFIDQIAEEIAWLGLQVHRDSHRFSRWSLSGSKSDCALVVDGQSVDVASAYPYSGLTGPDRVEGPLKLAGCVPWKMGGKIAVFEVPYPKVPVKLLVDDLKHLQASAGNFPKDIAHPVLAATAFGPDLATAKAAGAIGVIAVWREELEKPELAGHQYVPFTFPYRDIPAVWVAGPEGKQLLENARGGSHATLTLNALLSPGTLTDTVWTVVEGEITNESILVITHTDGVNVVEENGPIGVLELARMFAAGQPKPKRTLVFVFVTGHLRIPAVTNHGQATTAWLTAHPEWWSGKNGAPRAVAGLVIEHLGARRAFDEVNPAIELTYTTNATMQRILETSWAEADRTIGLALIARPRILQLGEGEPLYQHGIPAISLASVPDYLLASNADFFDIKLMHEQIGTFARALLSLENMSARKIGRIKRVTLLKTVSAWIQLAFFIGFDKSLRSHILQALCFKLTGLTISTFRRLVRWSKEQLLIE